MNETIKTIMERRSTRAFLSDQLGQRDIETIIESGLNAPSAMNTQGWHFTVIRNPHLIDWMNDQIKANLPPQMRERMLERYNGDENFSMFYNAPVIILVSGAADDSHTGANCGFATQNMCLAAHSLGIASCIIGLARLMFTPEKADEYLAKLQIPKGYQVQYAIAFGLAAADMPVPARIPGKVNYID